jgi:hypothetical protein
MDIIDAKCRKIQERDLEKMMNWRMRPDITKYMNTDPELTMEKQREWLQSIREDEKLDVWNGRKGFHWMLEVDGVDAGYVSLVNIDVSAKKIATGVYIAEKSKRSLRLIMDIQWNLYRYAFECLGMNKVCEEVFAENAAVNRILDMCGSKREGILRQHVCKNGTYYDVVTRGILRQEWIEKSKDLQFNMIRFEGEKEYGNIQ